MTRPTETPRRVYMVDEKVTADELEELHEVEEAYRRLREEGEDIPAEQLYRQMGLIDDDDETESEAFLRAMSTWAIIILAVAATAVGTLVILGVLR